MNSELDVATGELPSKRKLATAMGVALVAAGAILMTIVLPAEYGVDPLRTGAALGLTRLSAPVPLPQELAPRGATALTPVHEGPVSQYGAEYKIDSAQFSLGPYEYVEYKYRLEMGAALLYSWTASSQVIHDFHGEPDGGKPGYAESFDKQARRQGFGSFTAPFSGIHGWYWENPGGETVTVKLASAGFYSSALEFRFDHTRRPHELTALDTLTIPRKTDPAAGVP